MADIKKAMRTSKPTKDDPAGTRYIGGVKSIPYSGPKRPQRMPSGSVSARVGNYRADVDPEGIDPEMIETMGIKRKKR